MSENPNLLVMKLFILTQTCSEIQESITSMTQTSMQKALSFGNNVMDADFIVIFISCATTQHV